jgi:hypothetical protein
MRIGIERANQKGERKARDKNNASSGLTCAEGLDPTRDFSFSATVNDNSPLRLTRRKNLLPLTVLLINFAFQHLCSNCFTANPCPFISQIFITT